LNGALRLTPNTPYGNCGKKLLEKTKMQAIEFETIIDEGTLITHRKL